MHGYFAFGTLPVTNNESAIGGTKTTTIEAGPVDNIT